jgi:uncharacterized membrane protein YciS (DUF1049 family)
MYLSKNNNNYLSTNVFFEIGFNCCTLLVGLKFEKKNTFLEQTSKNLNKQKTDRNEERHTCYPSIKMMTKNH